MVRPRILTFLVTQILLKAVYATAIKCNVVAEFYCVTAAHTDKS